MLWVLYREVDPGETHKTPRETSRLSIGRPSLCAKTKYASIAQVILKVRLLQN